MDQLEKLTIERDLLNIENARLQSMIDKLLHYPPKSRTCQEMQIAIFTYEIALTKNIELKRALAVLEKNKGL